MKKLKNKVALLVAMVCLCVGMTGCSGKDATKEANGTGENGLYPLEVVDVNGETIVIQEEPGKVVSISPNITEMVFTLDAGEKLVGRTDYCDYPEDALEVETVGDYQMQDVEKIISLQPDLVIAVSYFDETNAAKLEAAGIQVLTLPDVGSLDDVYNMTTTLGQILNKENVAEARIKEMQEVISQVEEKVKDLEKPTVYYVVGYGEYGDYTAGGDTFTAQLLEKAGGDNIAKNISGWSISLEALIEADPEIIIINEALKDDFMNSPNYSELSAVKEGKVYTLDVSLLDRPGYRNAQGIEELAKIFHSEAFE